jgi:hypothetical protein
MKPSHFLEILVLLVLFVLSCASPFPATPGLGGRPSPQPTPHPQSRPAPQPAPQPRPPLVPVGGVPSLQPQPQPVPGNVRVEFVSLAPKLTTSAGKTMRGSTRAYPPPAVNGLVKAPYPSKVAYRDVEVQFNPRQIFANTAVN